MEFKFKLLTTSTTEDDSKHTKKSYVYGYKFGISRMAEYGSITDRPTCLNRIDHNIRRGTSVYVRPPKFICEKCHIVRDWRKGEIVNIDKNSGQVECDIHIVGAKTTFWTHLDNKDEIRSRTEHASYDLGSETDCENESETESETENEDESESFNEGDGDIGKTIGNYNRNYYPPFNNTYRQLIQTQQQQQPQQQPQRQYQLNFQNDSGNRYPTKYEESKYQNDSGNDSTNAPLFASPTSFS